MFFGEHELTDYLDVLKGFSFDLSTSRTNKTQSVAGRDGVRYLGSNFDSKIIPMPYQLTLDQLEKKRELAGILNVKEPQKLWFSNEPEKYYLAVPDGNFEVDDDMHISKGTINWLVVDGLAHASEEKTFTTTKPENRKIKSDFIHPPKIANSLIANKNDIRYGLASFTSLQPPFVVWGVSEQPHIDGLQYAEDGKVASITRGGNGGTFTYTVAASTIKKGDKLRITTYNAQGEICQSDVPVNIVGDPVDSTVPPFVGAKIVPNPYTVGQTKITGTYSGGTPITKSVLSINGTEKLIGVYRSGVLLGTASVDPTGSYTKSTTGMSLAAGAVINVAEIQPKGSGTIMGAQRRLTVGAESLMENNTPFQSFVGVSGSIVDYTQGISNTTWGTKNATMIKTTGGGTLNKAAIYPKYTATSTDKYIFSGYIKNNQTSNLTVNFNTLSTNIVLLPGEQKYISSVITPNGTSNPYIALQTINTSTNIDVVVFGLKVELGETVTPTVAQQVIPASNPLVAPYVNGVNEGDTNIIGSIAGPLNSILPQIFTPNPFLMAQWLVKFDAIWAIEKDYPNEFDRMTTLSEKVAHAKRIVRRIYPSVNIKGTSPQGNSAYVKVWINGAWIGSEENKTASYKKCGYNQTIAQQASLYIQNDGYVYLNCSSDLSNVAVASSVILDYAEMEIDIDTPLPDFIEIENTGTYPVYPKFSIEMSTENGSAVLVNENGNIIQIGNIDEVDAVPYKTTEMVIDERWEGTTLPAPWQLNAGDIRYKTYIQSGLANKKEGNVDLVKDKDSLIPVFPANSELLWAGPSIHRPIPAPASGIRTGNFTYKNRAHFGTDRPTMNRTEFNLQAGENVMLSIILRDDSGQMKDVTVEMWIGNDLYDKFVLDSKRFTSAFYGIEINKINGKIEFKVIDIRAITNEIVTGNAVEVRSWYVPAMDNVEITSLTTWFSNFYSVPGSKRAEVTDTKFTWIDSQNWNDIRNVFQPGDILSLDTSSAQISINTETSTTLGALGNQWDKFEVPPGKHRYYLYPSSWATQPTITATIREAWL